MEKLVIALFLCLALVQGKILTVTVGYQDGNQTCAHKCKFNLTDKEYFEIGDNEDKAYLISEAVFAQKMKDREVNFYVVGKVRNDETTSYLVGVTVKDNVFMEEIQGDKNLMKLKYCAEAEEESTKADAKKQERKLFELRTISKEPYFNHGSYWWYIGYEQLIELKTLSAQETKIGDQ